jgi:putative FmdB family regulatory protein
MPIYEYRCEKCKTQFEYIKLRPQPDGTRKCPECGAEAELAVSVPYMQPDDLWAGRVDPTLGYVTSRKQLREKERSRRPNDSCS